jgi:hypothetical protein
MGFNRPAGTDSDSSGIPAVVASAASHLRAIIKCASSASTDRCQAQSPLPVANGLIFPPEFWIHFREKTFY